MLHYYPPNYPQNIVSVLLVISRLVCGKHRARWDEYARATAFDAVLFLIYFLTCNIDVKNIYTEGCFRRTGGGFPG